MMHCGSFTYVDHGWQIFSVAASLCFSK